MIDTTRDAVEYNYQDSTPIGDESTEGHGTSVFLRESDRIFNTYSSYARGCEILLGTYNWLDLTPFDRQEDWEKPASRSDGLPMGWFRRHDRYDDSDQMNA